MEEKFKLTATEQSIIRQLEINARTPLSKIGKKIRMSQQRISYAVDSLIKKEIIKEFYTLIDYSKFDVINFRVYFKVSYTTQDEFKQLINHLKQESSTSWIATCGGRYDLICTFFAPNPSSFNKTLKGIMNKFPEQLQNHTVLTTIVTKYFGRKYLLSGISENPKEIIIGGDRLPEEFEEKDLKLINLISENARISAVELANKLQLTPKTVINRIKKLTKREVIKGFRPAINMKKTENIDFILIIKSHNVVPEVEDKLVNYLKTHPNVVSVVKTLGEWDLEIQIEVKNWYDYRKITIDIRERFKSLIQEIESIPLYKNYHKINFFPEFLLEK